MTNTDISTVTDSVLSAGIDLREEEALLANVSLPPGTATQPSSFNSQNGSFGPQFAHPGDERRQAEYKARHENDPFLNFRLLQGRFFQVTRDNKVGNVVGGGMVPTLDMQVLLSLAAKERISTLLTRAAAIGRQRRQANGTITGEWAPLVKGGNKTNTRKRSHSVASNDSEVVTSLPNETARALRALAKKDYEAEKERIDKKNAKATVPAAESTPGTPAEGGPSTPGSTTGEGPKKISAKEKSKAPKIDETQSQKNANQTAAWMAGGALGGRFGKKKKTYSWMTGGGIPAVSTPIGGRPSLPGTPGPDAGGPMEGVTPTGQGPLNAWGKRWGEWKEDGEKGQGLQLRDWIGALEADGRETKAVARAYFKLK